MDRNVPIYFGGVIAALALTTTTAGCQRANEEHVQRLDQISDRLDQIEQRLSERAAARPGAARPAPRARPNRPQPGVHHEVPVSDDDAYRGGKNAEVTIVAAFEFACPYCAQVGDTMDALLDEYDDDELKVVSKHFVVHPDTATDAALAACAANLQGKYGAFETALWAAAWHREPLRMNREALQKDALIALAKEIGLDASKLASDMAGPTCKQVLARNRAEMAALGVRGTPTIFVNGKLHSGPRTVEAFKQAIDAELN